MIVAKELRTLDDFEALKKGDVVAVEWRRDVQKTKKKRTRFASYEVVENKADQTEIILQKAMNVYFNYSMFLNPEEMGVSNVRAITLLTAEAR
jgi:hypothetical protein